MATFRKRGGKWHVQVRRKGYPAVAKSFELKADAQAWARQQEVLAERQDLEPARDHKLLQTITVADIVTRYRDEIVPTLKGAEVYRLVLNAVLRRPLAKVLLANLTTGMANAYVSERLRTVKPGTVNREVDILRTAFNQARKRWDIPIKENVFSLIDRPKNAPGRTRRFVGNERQDLMAAIRQCRNPWVRFLVELAVETGMRRGEIICARWVHLSWENRTLHIPITKNGHPRTIPLSGAACAVLKELEKRKVDDRILPISTHSAKEAWKRLAKRAGLVDFRFHDLRHEAISSFFERGLNVPEVALISGHRDPRMLFRYTHPKPEQVALKLR